MSVQSSQRVSRRRTMRRAAAKYAQFDQVPTEIGLRLIDHLLPVKISPERVLDVGAGAGRFTQALKALYSEADIIAVDHSVQMLQCYRGKWPWQRRTRVCAQNEALPVKTAAAQVITSNLGLSEGLPLDQAFAEFHRVLAPGGLLALSALGPDTFLELRRAWAGVSSIVALPSFIDMHDLGDALVRAGFTDVVLDCERITITYPNATEMLDELTALGVTNTGPDRPKHLLTPRTRGRLEADLNRHAAPLPLTLEVNFAHAWRPEGYNAQLVDIQGLSPR